MPINFINKKELIMSICETHQNHDHSHGENCGHKKVKHLDHYDFLHDGHLHHKHNDHFDEHTLEINEQNPTGCHETNDCGSHVHSKDCGHESIPHGDHIDYIVNGRLHHVHDGHCDDHGPVELIMN